MATQVNIHLKLQETKQGFVIAYNADLTASLASPEDQLLDFFSEEEPHVTLYLSTFRTDEMDHVIAATASAISHSSDVCSGANTMNMQNVYVSGTYAMLNTTITSCLQSLSDNIVLGTSQYLHPSAKTDIPSWVYELPPAEQFEKISLINSFGSPNVFSGFGPHLTLGVDTVNTTDLRNAVNTISRDFVPFTNSADLVGFGQVGDFGTVLRNKDFARPISISEKQCGAMNNLADPCADAMKVQAPPQFSLTFPTNYNYFTATCYRSLAPSWVDRIYNLVLNGYYNDNYFMRVINSTTLKIIQFGTNGDPAISNRYNWNSSKLSSCGVVTPQPPDMNYELNLSNTYGTLSMSTSFNDDTETTWNSTAELFINTGDNVRLDPMLFVPICTIDDIGMANLKKFPSAGEITELGGTGVSLNKLYAEGNSYISTNPHWSDMAISGAVSVSCNDSACPCYKSNNDDKRTTSAGNALLIVILILSSLSLLFTLLKRRRNILTRMGFQKLPHDDDNPPERK